jgi:GNAT superfamily N-acetyltransferase
MHAATVSALSDYYTDLFGIDHAALWQGITVRSHTGRLHDYEGYYVAWRGDGVHVSMPPSGGSEVTRDLSTATVETLQKPDFWREFAASRGLQVIGPSTHAYLDRDPGPIDGVTIPHDHDLRSLREAVDEADWVESGWNDQPPHIFGLYEEDVLVAAANLNPFHQHPRDIGVVVARGMRGLGLSKRVAQQAASFAIRTHGFARWGTRNSNAASLAASRRLGFERWCDQLAVR